MERQEQQNNKGGGRAAWRGGLGAALVVAGLGVLWLVAWPREIAPTKISDLPPATSSGVVRVLGKAVGAAQVIRAAGQISGLRFAVADGTGQLAVTADAPQAQQLARWDRIPRAGDAVEVTGRLRSGPDGGVRLELRADTALKLRRQPGRRTVPAATP